MKPSNGAELQSLAVTYKRIIYKTVYKHWWMLPISIRVSYGIDDMYGDVTLRVIEKEKSFDVLKASGSTWVWHVAHNCCCSILERHNRLKNRNNGVFSLEMSPEQERMESRSRQVSVLGNKLCAQQSLARERESRMAVEVMLRAASDELREALSDILLAERMSYTKHARKKELAAEAQMLAHKHGVNGNDFRRVMQHLV